MFRKSKKRKETDSVREERMQTDASESAVSQIIISEGSFVNGELNITGNLTVDGEIAGRIHVGGHLIIGERGIVKTEGVTCNVGEVAGLVEGNMIATELLIIRANGYVKGDIVVKDMVIEKGGRFDGKCRYSISDSVNEVDIESQEESSVHACRSNAVLEETVDPEPQ